MIANLVIGTILLTLVLFARKRDKEDIYWRVGGTILGILNVLVYIL